MPHEYTGTDIAEILAADRRARDASGYGRRNGNGNGNGERRWPQWLQMILAVGTVVVAIVLAYAQLDKRISLIEQKLDFLVTNSGRR